MDVVERKLRKGLVPAVGTEYRRPSDPTGQGTMRPGPLDREVLRVIRKNGWVCREADGKPWVSSGEHIPEVRLERLLAMGLLKPLGDSLFGVPSQTYVPT